MSCPASAPSAIAASSSASAAAALRSTSGSTSRLSRAAGARPSRFGHVGRGDPLRLPVDSSCSSSDWLSRIDPAARIAMIASASASASTPSAAAISASRCVDRRRVDPREVVPLAPRQDRDRNLVRLGRGEDELHMLGRLFERLEERVERLLREHVDFVDDVNLEPRAAGPHGDVLAELADFVDAAVAGAVDLEHVDVVAGGDALADLALAAGRGRRAAFAVEALGENAGGGGLAHAAGAGEQIGVPDAVAGDGALQRLGDVLLADQLVEPSAADSAGRRRRTRRRQVRCRSWRRVVADATAAGSLLRLEARSSQRRLSVAEDSATSSGAASAVDERPPHKEAQAYGCCVSTLTRFARPPLQGPLVDGRLSGPPATGFSVVRLRPALVKGPRASGIIAWRYVDRRRRTACRRTRRRASWRALYPFASHWLDVAGARCTTSTKATATRRSRRCCSSTAIPPGRSTGGG